MCAAVTGQAGYGDTPAGPASGTLPTERLLVMTVAALPE